MGYILIARHGPTDDNNLDVEKYLDRYVPQIKKLINKIDYIDIDEIYTSPIDRCSESAYILGKALKIRKKHIYSRNELLRIDNDRECYCITRKNATGFGDFLRDIDRNILLITHSSVMKYIFSGLSHTKIHNVHIHTSSLSIFDTITQQFILFNHKWN
jgi:broad specificity phosphatase PhoE